MAKVARLQISRAIEQGDLNPVGMVVHSMLTEAQFQALNGASWVLAQGQSIVGSTYATITGLTNLPDCRGEFIRGLDNGRGVDAARVKGSFQANATAKNGLGISDPGHYHSAIGYNNNASGGDGTYPASMNTHSGANLTVYNMTNTNSSNVSLNAGDAETRPRNIAMNIFIKIN